MIPLKKQLPLFILFSLAVAIAVYFFNKDGFVSGIVFFACIIFSSFYSYFSQVLKVSLRIKKMEASFPDFLQLVASNLRAGMTIDRSIILGAREEFDPLDKEIMKAGKEIATGKSVEQALLNFAGRIKSEKISKTINLIISGIQSGGNLAILLEQTSVNLREKDFTEKRASSNVLMYVIFIFVAVALGAPALFSLSSILVEILGKLLKNLPDTASMSASLPFTMSSIQISPVFIIYFCIVFILVIDILASLVLGLVSKGEEKAGIKYLLPLIVISMVVFFLLRIALSGFIQNLFIA